MFLYICQNLKKKGMFLIFQAIQEKITSKQEAFDSLAERAQTLLQSTTDNRVTSQLTQLSSRYTSLIASSKVSILYIIFKDTQNLDMNKIKLCVMSNVASIIICIYLNSDHFPIVIIMELIISCSKSFF